MTFDAVLFDCEAAARLSGEDFLPEAIEAARSAVKAYPESLDAWVTFALLAQKAGQSDEARRAALQAIRIDSNNRNVRSILGI